MPTPQPAQTSRCVLVWVAASSVLVTLLRLLLPDLRLTAQWLENPGSQPVTLEVALAHVAAVLLAGCLLWWWVATTFAVLEAATSIRLGPCPRLLRRVVLAACGVGLASGLAPAHADQSAGQPPTPVGHAAIAGLQLPDRQAREEWSRPQRISTGRSRDDSRVTVRPGDSLWSIAEADLPPGADDSSIDARWREIWAANRASIGPDPGLIHPDTQLRLPARHPSNQEKT